MPPWRTPPWPLSRPAGGNQTPDDPCSPNPGGEGPSMGQDLPGNLAVDGTNFRGLLRTIPDRKTAVKEETSMMARFCRYIEKVFDFGERIAKLKDHRLRPRIPTSAIWGSVFFLFFMRERSLNAMEGQLRQPKRMERLIGNQKPSAARMGEVLGLIPPDLL